MSPDVKRRTYRSAKRSAAAEQTRADVLAAARRLFLEQGYLRTTVAEIARAAEVNVDTVYATAGRKPDLMRLVLETAISGSGRPVAAEDRDYVRAIRQASTAREKLTLYAAAIAEMAPRTAPVFEELRIAGLTDPGCAGLHREITERRAANMRLFAADLRVTGELREDLSDDEVADVVWATNSADYHLLLVRDRGWSIERYREHLAELWSRLLLA